MSTENSENAIKPEPLEACVKEESLDDEFIETPTKIIKNEPNIFCFDDLETNNNNSVKKESMFSALEEIKCDNEKCTLKVEVENEGVQYDSKELIKVHCPFCNKSFSNTRALFSHMKQIFRCRYRKPSAAKSWKNLLSKIFRPFKCQLCLKYFSTVQRRKEHIEKHFGKSCIICPFCGKLMIKQLEYFNHYRRHITKQLLIKCKFCPKKFAMKLNFLTHMQNHKKRSKRFKCKVCSRSFSNTKINRHNKQAKVSCPYCSKKFCEKTKLSTHLRSHTGERPFQCAVCYSGFSTKGNLIKHCRTHSGYKPYSCKVCLKSFSRPDSLNKHLLGVHKIFDSDLKGGNKQASSSLKGFGKNNEGVVCTICSNKYPSKQSLTSHMRVHNKEKNFQCEICSKTFFYKGLLTGHMKIHQDKKPFACTVCPKKFIKRNDLTRHTFTHTKEKNFKCEICYEKFSRKDVLRLHLRCHTGQRPYECGNCLKTFVQKSNLTHHKKRCTKYFQLQDD